MRKGGQNLKPSSRRTGSAGLHAKKSGLKKQKNHWFALMKPTSNLEIVGASFVCLARHGARDLLTLSASHFENFFGLPRHGGFAHRYGNLDDIHIPFNRVAS